VDIRIVTEYREVLTRGKFGFSRKLVDKFLKALLAEAQEVLSKPIPGHFLDEADRPFIEIAVAGQVEVVVTGNAKHFHIAERLGIPVKSPAEFLKWWGRSP
jgi:predicted nucleic acid-binding protein